MAFFLKVHESDDDCVVAICDEDILGKVFSCGDFVLDVDSDFFGGKLVDIDEIVDALEGASSVNVVGSRIIDELLLRGIVSDSSVKIVDGVKFAHIYRV
ncbi:MAG: DUF424 family protein [archaeon]